MLRGRSREGAWIEILGRLLSSPTVVCRSREGAWIEIIVYSIHNLYFISRSREGAWIEILGRLLSSPTVVCRSREGAWIEILDTAPGEMYPYPSLP